MIVTTTATVEGYRIKDYLQVVYGTDIYLVGGILGGGLADQEGVFGRALHRATSLMISKAPDADAIVGVHTEILSPGNLNHIIVVVTGTAVKLTYSWDDDNEDLPEL